MENTAAKGTPGGDESQAREAQRQVGPSQVGQAERRGLRAAAALCAREERSELTRAARRIEACRLAAPLPNRLSRSALPRQAVTAGWSCSGWGERGEERRRTTSLTYPPSPPSGLNSGGGGGGSRAWQIQIRTSGTRHCRGGAAFLRTFPWSVPKSGRSVLLT